MPHIIPLTAPLYITAAAIDIYLALRPTIQPTTIFRAAAALAIIAITIQIAFGLKSRKPLPFILASLTLTATQIVNGSALIAVNLAVKAVASIFAAWPEAITVEIVEESGEEVSERKEGESQATAG
ncbi:MAG: hypothetical protein QXL91_06960 [Candidatus Bathyarchaeia archaeon]